MVSGLSKKTSLILVIVALIMMGCSKSATQSGGLTGASAVEIEEIKNVLEAKQDSTKTFVFTGSNFKFMMDAKENPTIEVNEGDKVKIEFTSTEGFHDWVVDEFGATSKVRAGDPSTSVEFIADKKGTFEYYCSVGSHREMGMKGKLIVK